MTNRELANQFFNILEQIHQRGDQDLMLEVLIKHTASVIVDLPPEEAFRFMYVTTSAAISIAEAASQAAVAEMAATEMDEIFRRGP